jgi:DUF4097 and DUF4098 domain-containing protein YvlB
MNKHEFFAQLSRLLKVPAADKQNIIEEYESYINEAIASGELEEDVIASLETPQQIADQVNQELGGSQQEDSENQKSGFGSDFFDELDVDLEKAFKTSEEAIRKASDKITKSVQSINFKGILDKVMDGVDKVVDTVMDIDIKDTASVVVMRFDNSKVETFPYDETSLFIDIDDKNHDTLNVEVVPGQSKLMVKYLPTSLKLDIDLQDKEMKIKVPHTSIKFAEKKRLRIYVPESVQSLSIDSNCSLQVKDLRGSIAIEVKDASVQCKDLHVDELNLRQVDGPVTVKNINAKKIVITTEDGPLNLKEIDTQSLEVHQADGPFTLSGVRADDVWVESVDGPKILKDSSIKRLVLQGEDGPISLKNLRVGVLTGQVNDSLVHIKDCHIQDNQLGETL